MEGFCNSRYISTSIDPTNFDLTLNISGQKVNLQFLTSRKIYEVMVENLQLSYVLHIKNDHNYGYDYTDKEMKDLFLKPRSSTLIRKHR